MNIENLFPFGTRDLVISKALDMFKQDPENPDIPPPSVYVLRATQKIDEKGNPVFVQKGRNKGQPDMAIEAIPFVEDIIKLNTDLYNDLVAANKIILKQNEMIAQERKEAEEIRNAYINLREQHKKLLS